MAFFNIDPCDCTYLTLVLLSIGLRGTQKFCICIFVICGNEEISHKTKSGRACYLLLILFFILSA